MMDRRLDPAPPTGSPQERPRRHVAWRPGALAAFAALAFGAAACGSHEKAPTETAAPVVRGVPVETLQPTDVTDTYEAVGTVRSKVTSVLSAKVMGTVVAVPVREGDRVNRGQVLVEIDSRDTQTQVDKARAGIEEATEALAEVDSGMKAADQAVAAAEAQKKLALATFDRFQRLVQRDAVSRQEYEEVEARRAAAEAEAARAAEMRAGLAAKRRQVLAKREQAAADLANAQLYVGYARVTAPLAGLVTAKPVELGMLAAPGVPLVTVEDGRYRLEAEVEESHLGSIRVGQPVAVELDALARRELAGRVGEVAPSTDPATRSYTVKIDLPATSGLRSGLFGRARFPLGSRKVLTVPRAAVVVQGQLTGVYALEAGGVARLRLIQLGGATGDRVEVLAGLGPGDRIVAGGVSQVRDGARVQ